jgi:membrane protease YdiL (CAAX protease family)
MAVLPALGLLLTAGMIQSLLTALGEEIGWRGLLVPQLAQVTSLRNVWLISSVVWLLFHLPLILGGDYHADGTPLWFSLLCFAVMVFSMSAVMASIRLASGSL